MNDEETGVRAACPEDAHALRGLFDRLSSVVGNWRGGEELLTRSRKAADSALAGAADRVLFVGHDDGELIGAGVVTWVRSSGAPSGSLELWCLPGHPAASTIARQLLVRAEGLASSLGEISLDVLALPGDRLTKSLLEEEGYRARLIFMRRPPALRSATDGPGTVDRPG